MRRVNEQGSGQRISTEVITRPAVEHAKASYRVVKQRFDAVNTFILAHMSSMSMFRLLPSRARYYATEAKKGRLGATLSLDHFLQRGRVLSLYRTILRGTRRIGDPGTRSETRNFARAEFERHREVTDLGHIRYLLSTGKTEWESMERYIEGM
ncbi:putative Complex 1 protein [Seiridium cardinale]|uniref:LYR motif-containing protein 2 n=1 Tax=Seiridium cardinale TaxID=138064 RepID=A0ABR2Y180_9PEZI